MVKQRGKIGIGMVIQGYHGKMWAAKCMTCEGYLDPMSAKVLAATVAAQFCNDLGARKVFLEKDAKNVMEAVKS